MWYLLIPNFPLGMWRYQLCHILSYALDILLSFLNPLSFVVSHYAYFHFRHIKIPNIWHLKLCLYNVLACRTQILILKNCRYPLFVVSSYDYFRLWRNQLGHISNCALDIVLTFMTQLLFQNILCPLNKPVCDNQVREVSWY